MGFASESTVTAYASAPTRHASASPPSPSPSPSPSSSPFKLLPLHSPTRVVLAYGRPAATTSHHIVPLES
ncbi:hypothetical protein AB1N83_008086 [Pleurotus pulmonarius]